MKFVGQRFQKLDHEQDRQTNRQIQPHSRKVKNFRLNLHCFISQRHRWVCVLLMLKRSTRTCTGPHSHSAVSSPSSGIIMRGEERGGQEIGRESVKQFVHFVYRFSPQFENFPIIHLLILDQYVSRWGLSDISGAYPPAHACAPTDCAVICGRRSSACSAWWY